MRATAFSPFGLFMNGSVEATNLGAYFTFEAADLGAYLQTNRTLEGAKRKKGDSPVVDKPKTPEISPNGFSV